MSKAWRFKDTTASSGGNALGGLYVYNSQGFWIANDLFTTFTGNTTTNGFQAGAGITLDGGGNFTQFGTVINNKTFDTRYGITTRNKVSSVTFIQNDTNCSTNGGAGTALDASIGLDIGWLWYQNVLGTTDTNTGGENSVFGHQSNNCVIGFALGSQNGGGTSQPSNSGGGHFYGKSEISATSTGCDVGPNTLCSIGVSVLNSINNLISWQGKQQATGWHFDGSSGGNVMLQPAFSFSTSPAPPTGTNSTESYTGFCHAWAYTTTYSNATNIVDSGAQGTTEVLGQTLTPYGTNLSTFVGDNIPLTLTAVTLNATTGFQDNGAAASNHILLGNGTDYVDASGLPCAALAAFTGDTTTSAGSCSTTTGKVNGVA